MKVKEIEKYVKQTLEVSEKAREDDFYLWLIVADKIYGNKFDCIEDEFLFDKNIFDVLVLAKKLGLPAFESVTRCRRKLQAKYPNLCNEQTRQARAKKEEEYEEYARE